MAKLENLLISAFGVVGTLHFISLGIGLYNLNEPHNDISYSNIARTVIFPLVCGVIAYSIAVYEIKNNTD